MELLDPLNMSESDWPAGSHAVRVFAEEMCRLGSQHFVPNVRTRLMVLRDADVVLPVTINDAEYDNSYVCSPHTTMMYAKGELSLLDGNKALKALGAFYLNATAAVMKWARFNKVVYINNWLLSKTTYPVDWVPDGAALAALFRRAFPDHFITFKSLNYRQNKDLIEALKRGGFELTAAGQTYLFDDFQHTVVPRNDMKKDFKLLRTTSYKISWEKDLDQADFERIAELYYESYCEKHSFIHPVYSAEFMRMVYEADLMRFVCFRNEDNRIDAFQALLSAAPFSPLCAFGGEDPALNRKQGLFRMTTAITLETAMREGWIVNYGDANAGFKRNRGGKAVVDYKATYCRHLSAGRRLAMSAHTQVSNRAFLPVLQRIDAF